MRVSVASSIFLAASLAATGANAGGAFGEGQRGRVLEESVLVVWSGGRERLFVSAAVAGVSPPASYVFPVPTGARVDDATSSADVAKGFERLSAGRAPGPLGPSSPRTPRLPTSDATCREGELPCPPPSWLTARPASSRTFVQMPVVSGEPLRAPWVALSIDDAPHPIVPYAEPPDPRRDDSEPPAVDEAHPPRVSVWAELGIETKSGAWEKKMDATADGLTPALAQCFRPALEKTKRLGGDVHVQLRVGAAGDVSIDGSRASSAALRPVLRCFELAAGKAAWPSPGGRAAPFEIHATLRPPAAEPRVMRAYILSTIEGQPHLGTPEDPRIPTDTRVLVAREPDFGELEAAFTAPVLASLGITRGPRWRLLVLESIAEGRPVADDIVLRAVASLPPPKAGETPIPVLSRQDQPDAKPTRRKPRLWHRRPVRAAAGVLAVLALAWLAVWLESRREITSPSE